VVSNPTQGMDVCVRLFCVCVVLCIGSGLARGLSLVQGVLPTVYRIKKLKKRPRSNKKDCRAISGWIDRQTDRLAESLIRHLISKLTGQYTTD
jgi:hypothetical protein